MSFQKGFCSMNRKCISAVSGLTALIMGISGFSLFAGNNTPAFTETSVVYAVETGMRDISSADLVKEMGLGWNAGNTFDSLCAWITNGSPSDYETGWGNPVLTKEVIKKVKASGFTTVRIPVTWINCMDTSTNKVNDAWMARIKEVVDWCMEEDLYVIINVHHDGGSGDTSWIRNAANDYTGVEARFSSLWTQIGDTFKDYSDHLLFEAMNEVEFPTVSKSEAYEIINKLNQCFVDTVRATGGNNAKRHLIASGYNTDIAQTSDSRFQMPSDKEGRVILSLHYYSPPQFCVAEANVDWCTPQTTWGTADDYADLDSAMMKVYTNFISKGIPVIIGEYGVLTEQENNKDKASIRKYLSAVSEAALSYGMCTILWDAGSSGDMKYIDRNTVDFNDDEIEKIYADMSAKFKNGQIALKTPHVASYDEVPVTIPADGWLDISQYKNKKICGIRFGINCSTSWDSQGGGGINYADDWEDCLEFGFNSVYDTVEVIFTDAQKAKLADKIGVFFWWTLLDTPGDENSGHANELSFKDVKILLEDTNPAVTPAVTTTKPAETTSAATTTTLTETTTVQTETTTAQTTTVTSTSETTSAAPEAVKGDVDGNGTVTATDVVKLMQVLVGKVELDGTHKKNADMDSDGRLSIIDLIMLKNKILS